MVNTDWQGRHCQLTAGAKLAGCASSLEPLAAVALSRLRAYGQTPDPRGPPVGGLPNRWVAICLSANEILDPLRGHKNPPTRLEPHAPLEAWRCSSGRGTGDLQA
jgi:hypothetical protein